MAEIIRTDGTIESIKPLSKHFTLPELKPIVNGWIELVRYGANMPPDMCMIVNEEGWLIPLPLNPVASVLAGQPIAGDVLYCKFKDIE